MLFMTGSRSTEAFRLNHSVTLHFFFFFSQLGDLGCQTGALMVAAGVKYIP